MGNYLDSVFIHGVDAVFFDAVFTFYKISAKLNADEKRPPMYHHHFYYEFHVLLAGEALYMTSGDSVLVTSGSLLIIPPHVEHYPFQGENGTNEIVLGLTLRQKEPESEMFQYFLRTLNNISEKPITLTETLLKYFIEFYDGFQSTEMRDACLRQAMAYVIVVQLFDSINHFHVQSSSTKKTYKSDDPEFTLELMINDSRHSLQDIANALGYYTRHTYLLIVKKYGKSLTEIRQRNMLTTAKRLLTSTPPFSLETIALRSGFPSVDAMARSFHKWENTTPNEYKKRNKHI